MLLIQEVATTLRATSTNSLVPFLLSVLARGFFSAQDLGKPAQAQDARFSARQPCSGPCAFLLALRIFPVGFSVLAWPTGVAVIWTAESGEPALLSRAKQWAENTKREYYERVYCGIDSGDPHCPYPTTGAN